MLPLRNTSRGMIVFVFEDEQTPQQQNGTVSILPQFARWPSWVWISSSPLSRSHSHRYDVVQLPLECPSHAGFVSSQVPNLCSYVYSTGTFRDLRIIVFPLSHERVILAQHWQLDISITLQTLCMSKSSLLAQSIFILSPETRNSGASVHYVVFEFRTEDVYWPMKDNIFVTICNPW